MSSKKKVAIISNDAGGAEILSSWVKLNKDSFSSYSLSLEGPAKEIFKRKLGQISNVNLDRAIEDSDFILTGTSWSTDFEYKAIKISKKKKKFVVSFLDHWVNYKERFNRFGSEFPDEIWVGDYEAFKLARIIFPKISVKKVDNPYWIEIAEEYNQFQQKTESKKVNILFASSNIDDIKFFQKDIYFSDYDILEIFLKGIGTILPVGSIETITIKRHPSESSVKYNDFDCSIFPKKILITENRDNISLLKRHTHVAGFESMLLVIGNICGKKVINIDMNLSRLQNIPSKYIDYLIKKT